jgi:hypothetical protein
MHAGVPVHIRFSSRYYRIDLRFYGGGYMAYDKRSARRDKHDSVIELFDGSGKLRGTGRLYDVSKTGISFYSENVFTKGEKLKARLRMLGKGVLDVSGEIMWARDDKNRKLYGVKFDSVENVHPTGELKDPWD